MGIACPGTETRRENSAARAGGNPKILAVPMVDPDLEIPGKAAMPWTSPMIKA